MRFAQTAPLLFTGATAALALPLGSTGDTMHEIVAREARYDQSCSRKIPGTDKTYEPKARKALSDATQLALVALEGYNLEVNGFAESSAFSHYFGPGDTDQVKNMMQAISNIRLPVDDDDDGSQGYFVDIKCGSDQDKEECGRSVLAVTNAKPGETVVVLCDKFFSDKTVQTKQDLESKTFGTRRGQWCQTGENFPFFEVAGLTLFHELTHLHTVGQRAGLSERPDPEGFDSAGTVDVYVQGSDDDRKHYEKLEPWQAARKLHQLWEEHNGDESKYKPMTPTVENAESYAAAALEFYFLKNCGWDAIPHLAMATEL
ncbi:hypothetical protein PG996_011037 [Apiospora saccharicola]|uniref:Deuterolysin n=1 Tax=Apiospora saccharicola TaxID=335842 RepID=A0ABR1UDW9_9PEZI